MYGCKRLSPHDLRHVLSSQKKQSQLFPALSSADIRCALHDGHLSPGSYIARPGFSLYLFFSQIIIHYER